MGHWRDRSRRVRAVPVAVAAVTLLGPVLPAAAEETDPPIDVVEARFEGESVTMDAVWAEAGACLVWPEEVDQPECFRTEADMDARIAELERGSGGLELSIHLTAWPTSLGSIVSLSSTCSSYLRLYDGTSYGGAVLYLHGRFQWYDLAAFGFNNRTSSFKIGACSAYFADLAAGGGSWYPTSQTQAYDVAPSMASGWNNDVSSVYIT